MGEDPLDKIFLTEEQSKWFNEGRESMLRDIKRTKKTITKEVLRELKKDEISGELFDIKKTMHQLNYDFKYWKRKALRFEKKNLAVINLLPNLNMKEKYRKKIRNIITSSSRNYDPKKEELE